jgi:hypothetical protein
MLWLASVYPLVRLALSIMRVQLDRRRSSLAWPTWGVTAGRTIGLCRTSSTRTPTRQLWRPVSLHTFSSNRQFPSDLLIGLLTRGLGLWCLRADDLFRRLGRLDCPSLRLGPPGNFYCSSVLGGQRVKEMCVTDLTVNPYAKYFLGPDI